MHGLQALVAELTRLPMDSVLVVAARSQLLGLRVASCIEREQRRVHARGRSSGCSLPSRRRRRGGGESSRRRDDARLVAR